MNNELPSVHEKNNIIIEPLSQTNLLGALDVLDKVFGSSPNDKKQYTRGFHASLGDKKHLATYTDDKPEHLEYFVAVDKESGKVMGTTGLYAYPKDVKDNAVFVGWYCVHSAYRGKGIGKKLLDYTINRARSLGKEFLRVWTSDSPEWETARQMYNRRGFVITGTEPSDDYNYALIYMELKLN